MYFKCKVLLDQCLSFSLSLPFPLSLDSGNLKERPNLEKHKLYIIVPYGKRHLPV